MGWFKRVNNGHGTQSASAVLLHFPVGVFASALSTYWPVHGVLLTVGFLAYETIEDWRERDKSYRDVFGFLVGFATGTAAQIIGLAVVKYNLIGG